MNYEPYSLRRFYKKLLRLYPRGFRDQLGESMEQTFSDLCRERYEAGDGLLGFVLWTFAETFAGIIKENINIKKENIMMPILRQFGIVIIAVITAIAIIVSTYLTKNLNSMWIILIIWFVISFVWELWIKDKR